MSDQRPIGSFANQVKRINETCISGADVYSVTKYDGFVRSLDYFKKQVFSRDLSSYKIVKRGEFAYSTIHLDEGALGLLGDEEALISPMYTTFEVDESVDKIYLSYLLRSPELVSQYGLIGQGSVNRRKSVPFSSLAEIEVFTPPLPEQKKIAEILSGIDEAIKKTQSAGTQVDHTIQGIRDQTQTGKGTCTRIGDLIAKISTGVSVNSENRPCRASEQGILKVSCVSKGVFYPTENKVIQAEERERASMSVKKGMLLMSRANTPELVGACGMADNDYGDLFLPDKIWNLELSDSTPCDKRWLNNALNSGIVRSRIRDASTGTSSSMRNISQSNFCEIELIVPPLEIQQMQADAIDCLQKRRNAFAVKQAMHLMLKAALSEDLLSGRKRVSV